MGNCSRSFAVKAATPDVVQKQDERPRLVARTNANSARDWQVLRATWVEIFLRRPIQEDEGGSFVFCKKLLG